MRQEKGRLQMITTTNNRSYCCICNKRINSNEKALLGNIGSGMYGNRMHIKCFKNLNWDVIVDLMNTLEENEREDLEQAYEVLITI